MPSKRSKELRWVQLDNAAKIYPASRSNQWSSIYRLSVTLTENIDLPVLKSALEVTIKRFPAIAARLRRGLFWYYLQQLPCAPELSREYSYPLTYMGHKEIRKCAFRVIVHNNRIALEFFHSLTDGSGAMIFLKSLTAEYLEQKYNIFIPATDGILDRQEEPSEEELEDSFLKYAGKLPAKRKASNAWRPGGIPQPAGRLSLTCFKIPVKDALDAAHRHNVTLTAFLSAVMMQALLDLQNEKIRSERHRMPIKLFIPINLRNLFPSKTLRNFALYTIPEIDPRLGEYSFQEICDVVKYKMQTDYNQKHMSSLIAANVKSEHIMLIRIIPLFIKNIVMKMIFDSVGEKKSCMSLSNLGLVKIPEEMRPYVSRFDFILGVQATKPYNCGVLSYDDTIYVNFIRNVCDAELERHFFAVLRDMEIPVTVESNQK